MYQPLTAFIPSPVLVALNLFASSSSPILTGYFFFVFISFQNLFLETFFLLYYPFFSFYFLELSFPAPLPDWYCSLRIKKSSVFQSFLMLRVQYFKFPFYFSFFISFFSFTNNLLKINQARISIIRRVHVSVTKIPATQRFPI